MSIPFSFRLRHSGEVRTAAAVQASGRFEPLAVLGQGAFGVVYRVRDTATGAVVALKILQTRDADSLFRLKHEFRALADIRHPNLVELYELVVDGDEGFFTMELIEGVSVIEYVRAGWGADDAPTPEARARFFASARQLVAGITALHEAGKLHRDLKPQNTLVGTADGRLALLDFGLAVALGPVIGALPPDGELAGSLAYLAPELFAGAAASPAADLYSLGTLLFEICAGELPFGERLAWAVHEKVAGRRPPPLGRVAPWLPSAVAEVIDALLDPDPGARPDAATLRARLAAEDATPGRPARLPPAVFVGRAAELEALRAARAARREGAPVLVRIEGESGVGKSELARVFLAEAAADPDCLILAGRCHPSETVPYRAFDHLIDALSAHLCAMEQAACAALLPDEPAELVRLFPVLRRVPGLHDLASAEPTDPREARRRGFAALRVLLGRLARRLELVCWIDDLQWSDADSTALVRELLRPPDAPPLLLLVTVRAEQRAAAALLAPFEPGPDRIAIRTFDVRLAPLGAADARQLAAHLAGRAAVDLDGVVGEAGGSPLLVRQLVHHAAGHPGSLPAAAGLTAVVRERLTLLADPARRLLEVVCLAGAPLARELALAAAGAEARDRPVVRHLEQDGLLRSAPAEGEMAIEPYHDRIREAVVDGLPVEVRRTHHRGLADVLSRAPRAEPEVVFGHYRAADDPVRALEWGALAAQRASDALAFNDAARLYGEIVALAPAGDGRRADWQTRRAEALVNAGRGAAAAPAFLDAAAALTGEAACTARQQAAEQLLISGHIDDGSAVLRDVFRELDLSWPASTPGALAGAFARLLWLRARGLAPRPRRADPSRALRIDAYHAAAKGLVLVDPARGLAFAVASLVAALRAGDERRAARGLAAVGAGLVPAGGPLGRWGAQMLARARDSAARLDDPYLRGLTAITTAQERMMAARWRDMQRLCDDGAALLRAHCRGVTWELDIGSMAALRALEELGELEEMGRRAARLLREATEAGDRYGVLSHVGYHGIAELAAGRAAAARAMATQALAQWTQAGFFMQHFYVLRLLTLCDLYDGDAAAAWQRVTDAWRDIERSRLLSHALLRLDAFWLRARAGVALAAAGGDTSHPALATVTGDAARLARESREDARGHAALLRAALARLAGDPAGSRTALAEAQARYGACDMAVAAASAAARLAQLDGRPADASFAVLRRGGVADPVRFLAVYAPGFAAESGVTAT